VIEYDDADGEPEPVPLWVRRPVVADWLTPAEIREHAADDPDELAVRLEAAHRFLDGVKIWCEQERHRHVWDYTDHVGTGPDDQGDVQWWPPALTGARSSRVPAEIRDQVLGAGIQARPS
jgi:hypothetical protein